MKESRARGKQALFAAVMGMEVGDPLESALGTRPASQATKQTSGRPKKEKTVQVTVRLRINSACLLQRLVSGLQAKALQAGTGRGDATIGAVIEAALDLYAAKHLEGEKQVDGL